MALRNEYWNSETKGLYYLLHETLKMIESKIIKIYRIDGEVNSTIIETSTGFYRITGDSFYEANKESLKGHKEFRGVDESGFIITEVRSSMEHTVLKLSNCDFIIHHIDTPFLMVELSDNIKDDKEFLNWYYNDLQLLSNNLNYAVVKTKSNQ